MSVSKEKIFDWRRTRRFAKLCVAFTLIAFLFAAVYRSLLAPLLVSMFLCYLLLPLVKRLETYKIPRLASILTIMAVFGGVVAIVSIKVAPLVYFQALALIKLIPESFAAVSNIWIPAVERLVVEWGLMKAGAAHNFFDGLKIMARLEAHVERGLGGLLSTGISLAGGMINLGLIPFFLFFFLKDYQSLTDSLWSLVPKDLIPPTRSVTHRINLTLRSVLKGQATVAGILMVLYVIGLSIVGIQSAVIIGLVAGLCRIIPYLDVLVGAVLSTIVILSDFGGFGQVFGVIIVFLVVQALDGAFITPQIVGDRVGLHPMAIIISVIAFGNWFGFWGVLLAVPIVAVGKSLFVAAKPYYMASATYQAPWMYNPVPPPVPGERIEDGVKIDPV